MFVIVGLGNPGSEYRDTRHNIGFAVIDALAESLDVDLRAGRGEYMIGQTRHSHTKLVLVKPLTYMNNSGIAVKELVESNNLSFTELLIISDDFHLPLGSLRLKLRGSDGGHNGLYSIIYHLQSEDFPRLRCGIAGESLPRDKNMMAEYVLAPFEKNEQDIVRKEILRARDAALEASVSGMQNAMNNFNTRKI